VTENGHSNRILTVPNAISFVRLVGVGYFWWVLLVAENILLAGILIAVLGGTDWLDGYLARRLNQESELGKVLDPLADRLMIASAVIGGLIAEVVPAVIGWGLITREVFMGVIALVLVSKGAGVLEVRWLGKAATLALYFAIAGFYFLEVDFLTWLTWPVAWIGGIGGLVAYWIVAFSYLGDARAKLAELESQPESEET
jgi:cardiolipin synthase